MGAGRCIWRSRSRMGNWRPGRRIWGTRASRWKARSTGPAAGRACISAIRMVTRWRLRRRGCGRTGRGSEQEFDAAQDTDAELVAAVGLDVVVEFKRSLQLWGPPIRGGDPESLSFGIARDIVL